MHFNWRHRSRTTRLETALAATAGSRLGLWVIAPLVLVSAVLFLVGASAAWYAHRQGKRVSEVLAYDLAGVLACERLVLELRDVRLDLYHFADSADETDLDAAVSAQRDIERSFEQVEDTSTGAQTKELRDRTRQGYRRFYAKIADLRQIASREAKVQAGRETIELVNLEALAPAEKLLEHRKELASTSSERNQAMANRVGIGLLLIGVCGSVAGMLTGYSIARGVNRSIVQLRLRIRDMAGKLDEVVGPVTVAAGADLQELEAAMQMISEKSSTLIASLQDSQREALRSEQLAAVGKLAAGLAHELRNPLMSMKVLVQAAAERGDPAGLSGRDLAVVEEEINRLEKLTQNLLDFTRSNKPEKTRLDIRRLVEQTVHLVTAAAEQRDIHVKCDLPQVDLFIEADAAQMRQLLLNLLVNALDAVGEGGTIWVHVATTRDNGHAREGFGPDSPATSGRNRGVLIRVADDGCGLPDGLGERIYEPFVSTKELGVGLGLTNCMRIVQDHGGEIVAGDRLGGGADFSIRLPLAARDAAIAGGKPSQVATSNECN
jgi:signal transduction histidine kinase